MYIYIYIFSYIVRSSVYGIATLHANFVQS